MSNKRTTNVVLLLAAACLGTPIAVLAQAANAPAPSPATITPSPAPGAPTAPPAPGAPTAPPAPGAPTSPTALSAATGNAGATTPSDELASLQKQIAIWKARTEIAKYQAEFQGTKLKVGADTGPALGLAPAQVSTIAAGSPDVQVVSIRAYNGRYGALLQVDGQPVEVRAGDTLSDGWTVGEISDATVRLTRGKQRLTLRF